MNHKIKHGLFTLNVFKKLTSAKTKGVSYTVVSSPSLVAVSEAGPQQKTPDTEDVSEYVSHTTPFIILKYKHMLIN